MDTVTLKNERNKWFLFNERNKIVCETLPYGECLVKSEFLQNTEFKDLLQNIEDILFKVKNVYFWDTDLILYANQVRIEARALFEIKQAINWARKILANLKVKTPY